MRGHILVAEGVDVVVGVVAYGEYPVIIDILPEAVQTICARECGGLHRFCHADKPFFEWILPTAFHDAVYQHYAVVVEVVEYGVVCGICDAFVVAFGKAYEW